LFVSKNKKKCLRLPKKEQMKPTSIDLYVNTSYCKHCTDLINEINKHPDHHKNIRVFDIINGNYPDVLTHVPCIVIDGDLSKAKLGEECFDFFKGLDEKPVPTKKEALDEIQVKMLAEEEKKTDPQKAFEALLAARKK
jgi:hypothetical protein